MKNIIFTLAALVTVLTSNAQVECCPTDIQVTPTTITLKFPSLPNNGHIDEVRFRPVNGDAITLPVISVRKKTITVDNSTGEITSADTVKSIKLKSCGVIVSKCQITQVLPVDLTMFEGTRNGEVITFNFQTAMELNNSHFELQGLEEEEFITLAFQAGIGTTNEITDYRVEVINTDVELFRLKQVDFDGTVSFSDVIRVELNIEDKPLRTMRLNILGVETPNGNIILEIYKDKVIRKGITL